MSSGGRESRDLPGWEEMMTRKYPLTVAAVGLSILLSASPAFMQQAGAGNKNILIICGDENGTTMLCTSIDDVTLKNRLEVSMGHRVKMMPHNVDATQMLAAANAADLVIIVESVNSATIGRKLVSTPTPILISESFLQDEFGLVVPPFVPVDPGYPGGVTEAQLRSAAQLLQNAGFMLNIEVPPAAPAAANAAPGETNPAGRGANPAGRVANPAGPGANPAGRGANPAGPGANPAAPGVNPAGRGANPAGPGANPAGPGANPAGRGGIPGGRGGNPAYTAARNGAIAKAVAGITAPSHGVTVDQLYVVITNPNHPLAAGLSGRVQAYRLLREMNWGAHLAPGAQVVATLAPSLAAAGDAAANTATDYSGAAVIYYVPKGGALAEGANAAGLRIQYFVENENGPGTYNLLTPEGFRLFDAAVNWALTQK
jgi:hypothetical protein